MAMLERHRNVLYNHFAPQLGEEVTQALMSQFPSRDVEEPVTKADLLLTKAELREELGDVREEIGDVRLEVRDVRLELEAFKTEVQRMFSRQTIWLTTWLTTAIGVAVGVVLQAG